MLYVSLTLMFTIYGKIKTFHKDWGELPAVVKTGSNFTYKQWHLSKSINNLHPFSRNFWACNENRPLAVSTTAV